MVAKSNPGIPSKIQTPDGGDHLIVAKGGSIVVEDGGSLIIGGVPVDPSGGGLPAGGTPGQVVTKTLSGADWETPSIGAGLITTTQVTTGATQTDLAWPAGDWVIWAVEVTSGGTADNEILNFVGPPDNAVNSSVGRTVNIVFTDQANPSDVLHVTVNGGADTITCIDNLGVSIGNFDTGVLNQAGNNLIFGFNGDVIDRYRWNCIYGDWDSATVIANKRFALPANGAFGQLLFSGGGGGEGIWGSTFPTPARLLYGPTGFITSSYPAVSANLGLVGISDAITPVVGSPVVGGGSISCVAISNGTDYIVMFILGALG